MGEPFLLSDGKLLEYEKAVQKDPIYDRVKSIDEPVEMMGAFIRSATRLQDKTVSQNDYKYYENLIDCAEKLKGHYLALRQTG